MTLWTMYVDDGHSEPVRGLYDSEESALNSLIQNYAPGEGERRSTILDRLTGSDGFVIYLDAWVEPQHVDDEDEAKAMKALKNVRAPQHDDDWGDDG